MYANSSFVSRSAAARRSADSASASPGLLSGFYGHWRVLISARSARPFRRGACWSSVLCTPLLAAFVRSFAELAGCPSVLQDARVVRPRLMGGKTWGGYQASFTPQIYVRFWCFWGGCQSDPAGAPPPAPPRGPRHAPMTASHAKFQRQRCSGRAATVGGSIRRSTPRGPLSFIFSLIAAHALRAAFA